MPTLPTNTIMQRSPLSQRGKAMPGLLTCSLRHAAVMPQAPELPEPPTRGCCPFSSSLSCQDKGSWTLSAQEVEY